MKLHITVLSFIVFFIACEKKVDFDLKESTTLLTVDASIESNDAPVVILTKSLNYFSKVSADVIANSLVKDAEVFISDGSKTHKLKRYDINITGANVAFSFYSTDPSSPSTIITGEFGKTYSLRILWQGKEYTSTTTIPLLTKKIDSMWSARPPNTPDTSKRMVVKATVTDPPGFGNYIRYFTKVNSEQFNPGLNSVFDDALVNNSTYTVDVDKGVDRNNDIDFDNYGFFAKGDTVTVKFSNIDKATYDFWRTVEFSYQSIGNPFSSPTKILGNISNGALGYFGGYANQFKTIIIPK